MNKANHKHTSVNLPYGDQNISFSKPPHSKILATPGHSNATSPEGFKEILATELAAKQWDFSSIAIIVADKTRLCDYPTYLPVLLQSLQDLGANPKNITLYIAYGMHKPHTTAENLAAYGTSFNKYNWVHHNSQDLNNFIELGISRQGTRVMVRKDIAKATMKITFGAISHHYFAGYGGGRKLLFPGLGEKSAIFNNHRLFLDRKEKKLHQNCQLGRLLDNPLAMDLLEVYNFCPADFEIHGIMDNHGKVCNLLAGAGYPSFLKAAALHSEGTELQSDQSFDLVVASCGGFPKDINLVQSHKAFHNAALWVKDQGHLILVTQCPDGVGSETFLPWFSYKTRQEAFEKLAGGFIGNGGTALCFMEKLDRIKVSLVTELSSDICEKVGVTKISEIEAAHLINTAQSSAFIPNASILVKR